MSRRLRRGRWSGERVQTGAETPPRNMRKVPQFQVLLALSSLCDRNGVIARFVATDGGITRVYPRRCLASSCVCACVCGRYRHTVAMVSPRYPHSISRAGRKAS